MTTRVTILVLLVGFVLISPVLAAALVNVTATGHPVGNPAELPPLTLVGLVLLAPFVLLVPVLLLAGPLSLPVLAVALVVWLMDRNGKRTAQ